MLHLSDTQIYKNILVSPTNIIRFSWKGLPETNTLAYYENWQITAEKSFMTLAPGNLKEVKNAFSRFSKTQ